MLLMGFESTAPVFELANILAIDSEATVILIDWLTPWSESASELYRPSDRRLSAK
jgi:hypothetical protein